VQLVLGSKLPEADAPLADKFLQGLGMALCNKLTPYIFMTPETRPDPALISSADLALRYRNEILHGLRNRRGMYRRRLRSNQELSAAYSATLKLCNCYRVAFENASTGLSGQ
jgi:hypothetical protein